MGKNKSLSLINPLYLLLWLALSLSMGANHEPFADEAQSYLIARDASLKELVASLARSEGHPLLWYLWLKLLLCCGLSYKSLYLSSILPNFAAVALFIYKAPFKTAARFLFPLTYFIFYQYNVIARSYSLLFLLVVITALCYPRRRQKPYVYMFILMLLGMVSAYSFILSCSLFLMLFIETCRQRDRIFAPAALFLFYIAVTIYILLPNKDVAYLNWYTVKSMYLPVNIFRFASVGLINSADYQIENYPFNLIGLAFFILMGIMLYKSYKEKFIYLLLPTIAFGFVIPAHPWHAGILILWVLLLFWLWPPISPSKLLTIIIKIFFVVELIWSAYALIHEIKMPYSAAQPLHDFMKEKNISIEETALLHFNATAVCPYFKTPACSYWPWQKKGFVSQTLWDKEEMLNKKSVIINQELYDAYPKYMDSFQKKGNYKLKIFESSHFFGISSLKEIETFYLYYKERENDKLP